MAKRSYSFKGRETYRGSGRDDRNISFNIKIVNENYFEGELIKGEKRPKKICGYFLDSDDQKNKLLLLRKKSDGDHGKRVYILEEITAHNGVRYDGVRYATSERIKNGFDPESLIKCVNQRVELGLNDVRLEDIPQPIRNRLSLITGTLEETLENSN
jgi:hypothetical protein